MISVLMSVVVHSGSPPSLHNDLTDLDNDSSDQEMDTDDLRDFEDQYPHIPSSSTAYVHIVYDITPDIIPDICL